MTTWQGIGKPALPKEWQTLLGITMLLILPSVRPESMGWTQGLVPLPLSYYLVSLGITRANNHIINVWLTACLVVIIFGSMPAFIFTSTMLPVGMIIGRSLQRDESPPQAGLKALGVLLALWIGFWSAYGTATQTNPYQEMLTSMDNSLTAAISLYQNDASLSLSDKDEITNTIQMLREIIGKIAPALLAMTAITTVWLNMLLGQWLTNRRLQAKTTWPPFKNWRLPEQLIWVIIGGGCAAFIPNEFVKNIGINVLIIFGALYFFQGIAVLAKLFAKWSVPGPMRALLYAITILQGTGLIALAVLGVADIWVNFGAPRPNNDPID